MKRFIIAILVCAFCVSCERRQAFEEVQWVTMGTVATFKCRNAADLEKAHVVRDVFDEVERLLNAHVQTSELSHLAPLSEKQIVANCNPLVRPCYEAAFRFRDLTGAIFNPRWQGENTLDLGGIAKGFALDLAAEKIGPCDALIDLGGNLKVCGGEWKVGIYGSDKTVVLTQGMSSSTSGEYFRGHHIKDGRTGEDAEGSAYSITVIHPTSAMVADALSTSLFIMGREQGAAFIRGAFPSSTAIWQ